MVHIFLKLYFLNKNNNKNNNNKIQSRVSSKLSPYDPDAKMKFVYDKASKSPVQNYQTDMFDLSSLPFTFYTV